MRSQVYCNQGVPLSVLMPIRSRLIRDIAQYTASNPLGSGVLCASCSTEGFGNIPAAKVAKPAVKKRAVKRVEEREVRAVPTLQSLCITVRCQSRPRLD